MNSIHPEKPARLPVKGLSRNKILNALDDFNTEDPDYKGGRIWSLVYYLGESHTRFLKEAYGKYFSANGLNPMAFKSLKKLETEVIQMTAHLLHGDDNVAGVMTAGGTESCLLAVKTYRDLARATRRVKKPEMILPETAHVAWEKGAKYFDVKAVHAPLDSSYRVNVKAAEKLINRNTVMILGSAPDYPHGMIDPIEELGALALKKNIPLHVDACVGGYLLPFLEKIGHDIPKWDYRVKGVTSISADTHKYGFAAKGASTITYRNLELLTHQLFVYENWPGGVFASPALLGTRPGGAYAAAWGAMMTIGEEGYIKIARETMETTKRLIKGIESIDELGIIGNPVTSLFSYQSVVKDVNIYAVGDAMERKGWHIDRLQRPEALHVMVTPLHAAVVEKYIEDLQDSVAHVKKHPELAQSGGAAMYGLIANIPMRGLVKKNVLKMFASMYGPEMKMIDPTPSEMGDAPAVDNFATKAAMFYLKLKNRFKS